MAGVQEFPPGFRTEEIATDGATIAAILAFSATYRDKLDERRGQLIATGAESDGASP